MFCLIIGNEPLCVWVHSKTALFITLFFCLYYKNLSH